MEQALLAKEENIARIEKEKEDSVVKTEDVERQIDQKMKRLRRLKYENK